MRRVYVIASVFFVTAVLVAGGWAAATRVIVGTSKNDSFRGTARADILDGRAGNDRLMGLAGNDVLIGGRGRDLLVGGGGKDRLRCGPGTDTARADTSDTVAADCEVVTGLPGTEPSPPTETTPPPTAQVAFPGRYCGYTNQGKIICVTVASNSGRVTTYRLSGVVDCGSEKATFSFVTFGPGPIQADLTFSRSADEVPPDQTDLKNITVSWEISGTFDTKGNVTGTFWLKRLSFDSAGAHSDCTSAPTAWQAKLGA